MKNSLAIAAIGLSTVSLAATSYILYKVFKIADKLDVKIDNLSETIDVDIPEKAVTEAVDRAIDKEAKKKANEVSISIRNAAAKCIEEEVNNEINSEKAYLHDVVKAKIMKKAENIDISELKEEIKETCAMKATEKFDGELNDILDKYNQKLEYISTIYESMARNFGNNGKIVLP